MRRLWFIAGTMLLIAGIGLLATGTGNHATGQLWYSYAPHSLNQLQSIIQRYIWPDLWDFIFIPFLTGRVDLIIIGAGIALILLSALIRRRPS